MAGIPFAQAARVAVSVDFAIDDIEPGLAGEVLQILLSRSESSPSKNTDSQRVQGRDSPLPPGEHENNGESLHGQAGGTKRHGIFPVREYGEGIR